MSRQLSSSLSLRFRDVLYNLAPQRRFGAPYRTLSVPILHIYQWMKLQSHVVSHHCGFSRDII